MTTKWIELTGLDDLPVLTAVDHIVRIRAVAAVEGQKTEINVRTGLFFVKEDYVTVRLRVLGAE